MGINTLLASWGDLTFQVPGDIKRSCNCDPGQGGESGWIQSRTVVDDLWQMFGDLCAPGGWGKSGLKFCLTFPEQVCSHLRTKDGCFLPASFSGSLAFNRNKWAPLLTLWRAAPLPILSPILGILPSAMDAAPTRLQTSFMQLPTAGSRGCCADVGPT